MNETRRAALGFAAVTLALIPVGYASMFSVLSAYDDEGYFLLTLRDYLSGHALYSQISSIYGPFYYEANAAVFRLVNLQVGHDTGRAITLVIWLLGSLAAGGAVYRLTRSLVLGLSAELVTFHVLASLTAEPMHASGVLSLLLIGLVAAAAFRSQWPRATALLIGSIVAAACLVKINVGIFAGLAVTFALAASLSGRWRLNILGAAGHLLIAAVLLVMAGQLGQEWVFEYAAVVVISAYAVWIVCSFGPRASPSPPCVAWLGLGAAVLAIACIAIAILGGTRPADMFISLVVAPLRLPQLYSWPLKINVGYVICAVALIAGAVILAMRVRKGAALAIPGLARIAVGSFTWLAVLLLPSSLFFLALPVAWVAALDPRRVPGDATAPYARLLLPALAVIESVQAYPIAGTQLSMAALLLVPVGAITLNDGILQLRDLANNGSRRALLRVAAWAAPGVLIANLAFYQLFAFLAISGYVSTEPLGLRGAASVRVEPQRAVALRSLVAAIRQDCRSFITLPGMSSLYLWTDQPPPAQLYAGVWMYSLSSSQQQQIVDQLRGRSRLCAVKNQAVVDFWAEGRPVPDRPLVEYIDSAFVPERTFGDFELLVGR